MTFLELLRTVGYAGVWGSAVPVLVGAFRLSDRPSEQRAVWVWLTVGLTINLWMMVAGLSSGTNGDLGELGRSVFAVTGLFAIGELAPSRKVRGWILSGIALYLLLWIWRAVEADFAKAFGPYSGPAQNLVLTLAVLAFLWDLSRAPQFPGIRSFGVTIAMGALVIHGPAIALEAVSFLFYETHTQLVQVLWMFRGLLLLTGLAFFTLAFIWTIPRRSLSGSSSSVP